MKFGFMIEGGDVNSISELAQEAEAAGWDGVFIADAIDIGFPNAPPFPWFDPWIVLAAMAARTKRIKIGTIIAAITRRRPWKVARETTTLDHLSKGRVIFGVGLARPRTVAFPRLANRSISRLELKYWMNRWRLFQDCGPAIRLVSPANATRSKK